MAYWDNERTRASGGCKGGRGVVGYMAGATRAEFEDGDFHGREAYCCSEPPTGGSTTACGRSVTRQAARRWTETAQRPVIVVSHRTPPPASVQRS